MTCGDNVDRSRVKDFAYDASGVAESGFFLLTRRRCELCLSRGVYMEAF